MAKKIVVNIEHICIHMVEGGKKNDPFGDIISHVRSAHKEVINKLALRDWIASCLTKEALEEVKDDKDVIVIINAIQKNDARSIENAQFNDTVSKTFVDKILNQDYINDKEEQYRQLVTGKKSNK